MSEEIALPPIGRPATRALASVGITSLDGVTSLSRAEVAELHGVGQKAIRILDDALSAHSLGFREA